MPDIVPVTPPSGLHWSSMVMVMFDAVVVAVGALVGSGVLWCASAMPVLSAIRPTASATVAASVMLTRAALRPDWSLNSDAIMQSPM
jgi:hypothetical protein